MAAKTLDDATIRNYRLPADKAEATLSDGGGLNLRVRGTGAKTWLFYYTSPITGKRPKITLGTYPAMSLAEARVAAAAHQRAVEQGKDPQIEREQAAVATAVGGEAPRTVQQLFDRWRDEWLVPQHEDQGAYTAGQLTRHALPLIGKLELTRVRAGHVVATLMPLKNAGKARTAGVVLSSIRQMFAYAIERDWLQGDPSAAIKKSRWDTSRPKQRVLTDAEVTMLAKLLPAADLAPHIECAIWIMLSCMTRVEETSLARLAHVDFDAKTWYIPAANQKKVRGAERRDYVVQLSDFALAQFKRLAALPQEIAEARNSKLPKKNRLAEVPPVAVDYLFPNRENTGPVNNKTITHALHDRQRPDAKPLPGRTPLTTALCLPGGPFTPHDLRRTGSTMMRELRTSQDVIDRCLNHAEADAIIATYQQARLAAEKREAWQKLGEHLEALIAAK